MKDEQPKREKVLATPRARRQARSQGIDLDGLRGTGLGGRILEADVLRAGPSATCSSSLIKLTPMRRAIARMTSESFATIPHFYLNAEIDATGLLQTLQKYSPTERQPASTRVSLTDLLLQAQAQALADCPFMNMLWAGDALRQLKSIAIGLVISVPSGVMVPIVESPHLLDVEALAKIRARLLTQCRNGRLPASALVGGPGCVESATSLNNLGKGSVDRLFPVIHVNQSSMLAVGALAKRPWVIGEEIVVRPTLKLTLAVDHRVIDGAPAAEFLNRLSSLLTGWGSE